MSTSRPVRLRILRIVHTIAACGALIAFTPAAAAAQPASPAPGDALALERAIELAVAHNRQLETARLEVARASERLAAARTRRLPIFETSVQGSQLLTPATFSFPRAAFGEYPGIGPIPSADTEIKSPRQPTMYLASQVTQPITQLVRIGLDIRSAAAARDLEHERMRDRQRATVADVKRLYFAIQQTESALEASEETLALYRELQRTLETRVIQKVALRSDALDVSARLAHEELTRLTRRHTLDGQKEQLNQLLGRDVRTAFTTSPVAAISPIEVDVDAARTRALDRRPDVRSARLRVTQAELEARARKAERLPDVSLALAYSSNMNIDVLPRNLATVGVQVTWEPFDWGRKSRELAAASHVVVQSRLAVRDAEDRIVLEINAAFRKLAEARTRLAVADADRATAREKLRVRTAQFQVQAALLTDVLQVRAGVADSHDRYQQALLAFWNARADFEQAAGEGL